MHPIQCLLFTFRSRSEAAAFFSLLEIIPGIARAHPRLRIGAIEDYAEPAVRFQTLIRPLLRSARLAKRADLALKVERHKTATGLMFHYQKERPRARTGRPCLRAKVRKSFSE